MRIFKTEGVVRFARQEQVSDASLKAAIDRAECGSIDAYLGGGLIKQRIARGGRGRSSGFRMIVAYLAKDRAVFLYGLAKNERGNISDDELLTLRTIGKIWLAAPADKVSLALRDGDLQEIDNDESNF